LGTKCPLVMFTFVLPLARSGLCPPDCVYVQFGVDPRASLLEVLVSLALGWGVWVLLDGLDLLSIHGDTGAKWVRWVRWVR
jgi:hypothetical protein